jgi:hypothetical protein
MATEGLHDGDGVREGSTMAGSTMAMASWRPSRRRPGGLTTTTMGGHDGGDGRAHDGGDGRAHDDDGMDPPRRRPGRAEIVVRRRLGGGFQGGG